MSTYSMICFGIKFEEGFEFPWDNESEDGFDGIEEWWLRLSGWVAPFEVFDEKGEYLPEFSNEDPRVDEYFDNRRLWKDTHPIPIELVDYCSSECAMYIIADPESCITACRGYPEELTQEQLVYSYETAQKLIRFCEEHGIDTGNEIPKWWLSSYCD